MYEHSRELNMFNINSALHYSFSLARSNVATAFSSTQVLHMPVRTCVCVQQPTIRTSIARAGPKHQEPVSTFGGFQRAKQKRSCRYVANGAFKNIQARSFAHLIRTVSPTILSNVGHYGVILWIIFVQRLEVICALEAHFLECSSWHKSA